MSHHLKNAPLYSEQVTAHVRQTVDEMLTRIDRDGADAIRHYSRELDGWDPESFIVDARHRRSRRASSSTASCAPHIALRPGRRSAAFATAQRADTPRSRDRDAAGRDARASPHPRADRRLLCPRRPLPDARLVLHDGDRPEGRRRRARRGVRAASARRAGIHPAMLYAMATSGADDDPRARRRPGAGGAGARDRGSAGRRHDRRRRQRLRGRGQAPALRRRRDRPARRADGDRDHRRRERRPELVAADLLGQAEHGPTSPRRADHDLAGVRRGGARGDRRLAADAGRPRDVAGAAWERARLGRVVVRRPRCGDRAVRRDRARASRGAGRRAARSTTADRLRNYGSLFLGDAGDRRLRRQGRRHQPRAADHGRRHATPAASGSASSSRPAPTSG